jgi:hypothetical protein
MPHRRSDSEWEQLRNAGYQFLLEQAKMGVDTSYTEMNASLAHRTGLRPFDFDWEVERAAMGRLLGEITLLHRAQTQSTMMISSLVRYLNENDPGPGFFRLAVELGHLPARASEPDRTGFWGQKVKEVFTFYERTGAVT